MAKSGIDFFPLDVTLDTKFELIEAEYGLTGFGVVVHLLQEIYGKAGYYIEWTEEVALLFARKVGLGGSVVSEIIEASIRRGMFDKEKYDKYHVLTSRGIQKRYFEAVSRRKVLEVDYNILLVDCALLLPNVDIQAKNVNILSKNADISKQSKVEKSKVEKSKEEYIGAEPQAPHAPSLEQTKKRKKFAPPTLEEVTAYAVERGHPELAKKFFEYFDVGGWIDAKGQPVKNWKQKFLTWESNQSGTARQAPAVRRNATYIQHGNDMGEFERDAVRKMMERGLQNGD